MGSSVPVAVAHTLTNMGKGQNEGDAGGFSEEQVQMYKDCFKLMDINKDGMIDKNDLRGAFDNVGVLMSEGELDSLLGEISGPCSPDNMIAMFQEKMSGDSNDSDDVIVKAFKSKDVIGMFVAIKEEEKKEEAPPPVEEAPAAAEEPEEGEAKKKKKKKKKAAK